MILFWQRCRSVKAGPFINHGMDKLFYRCSLKRGHTGVHVHRFPLGGRVTWATIQQLYECTPWYIRLRDWWVEASTSA